MALEGFSSPNLESADHIFPSFPLSKEPLTMALLWHLCTHMYALPSLYVELCPAKHIHECITPISKALSSHTLVHLSYGCLLQYSTCTSLSTDQEQALLRFQLDIQTPNVSWPLSNDMLLIELVWRLVHACGYIYHPSHTLNSEVILSVADTQ